MMKLYSMTTLSTGLDVLEMLKGRLHGVIGLTKREPGDSISGFTHMEQWCKENNVEFIPVNDYSLKSNEDRKTLLTLDADIILVNGWQRLIPEWLIQHCKLGALGVHGSAYGITKGRGRSPQNWALLMGKQHFSVSLFKIDKGIDSGAVVASKTFDYTEFDDIKTSYYKVNDCVYEMIIDLLNDDTANLNALSVNQEDSPQYLPQRYPEDGAIDWSRASEDIHNFVRALTSPYPCAFSHRSNGEKVSVISGRPYSTTPNSAENGEIIRIYNGGEVLMSTGNGSYLIDSYEVQGDALHQGEKLNSADFTEQLRNIILRHIEKFPNQPIADELLEIADFKGGMSK